MKTNIFLVHTEYHLMLSINLILDRFIDCKNCIYYTKGKRLSREFKSNNSSIVFRPIFPDEFGSKTLFDDMIGKHPENFFYFQDNSSFNCYAAYKMHKKGVNVALLQDGLKPYVVWNKKHEFLSMVKDTVLAYKELFKGRLYLSTVIPMYLYRYGCDSFIDELWLTYPDKFINKYNKILKQLPAFSDDAISLLNSIFNFDKNKFDMNSILVVGQPAESITIMETDINIIKYIASNFQKTILYKPHPLISDIHLNKIKEIENVIIIKEIFPVELLMIQMRDTVIISRHSTSMLTDNPSCRYYWTHKLFPKSSLTDQLAIINPTSHIVEVKKINEIL